MNRYVYHGIAEPPPRPNAGGNIIRLGAVASSQSIVSEPLTRIINPPKPIQVCPSWGCSGEPRTRVIGTPIPMPGSTSTVPQTPPPEIPWGGWQTDNPSLLPTSPAPSPAVLVPASQTAPQNTNPGLPLSSTGSSVSGWSPNTSLSIGYAIVDQYGNLQEVTTVGKTGAQVPNFNPNVGGTTTDGSLVWTNQGPSGAAASSSSLSSWFTESTLINGIPNWGLLAAGLGLWLMTKKK